MTLLNILKKPVHELIRQRYSCRTYKTQSISSNDLSELDAFTKICQSGPSGTSFEFTIAATSTGDSKSLKSLGTYGFIKDPAGFVIGVMKDQPRALEDFGYQMELIVLRAVDLGIGSCWLGGTFTKSRFAKLVKLKKGNLFLLLFLLGIQPIKKPGWIGFRGLPLEQIGVYPGKICFIQARLNKPFPQPWPIISAKHLRWYGWHHQPQINSPGESSARMTCGTSIFNERRSTLLPYLIFYWVCQTSSVSI